MKRILIIPFFIILISFSCSEEGNTILETENSAPVMKVMPLGASRTSDRRPIHKSFRFYLWEDLVENNLGIDFIGTFIDSAIVLLTLLLMVMNLQSENIKAEEDGLLVKF